MAAVLRKLRCDLRSNRVQRLALVVLIAFAVAALTTSLTIQMRGGTAWEQLFREANGAHAWFYGDAAAVAEISDRPEVTNRTKVYPVAQASVPAASGPVRGGVPILIEGIGIEPPTIDRPIVVSGRWLRGDGEIVLPRRFAAENGYAPGDTIEVVTEGGAASLVVVGVAVFAGHSPYALPVIAWVTPETLAGVLAPRLSAVGVQFESRGMARAFRDSLETERPGLQFALVEDWNGVRQQNDEATEVIATFLGIFSLFALISASFVIVNAMGGRILARYRDIGLMKAMGFTPRQVAGGLLIEQLGVGVVAVTLGLLLGRFLTPLLDDEASKEFATESLGYFRPGLSIAIGAGVLSLITVSTLVPAWRASLIPSVQAILLGPGRIASQPSRLGRVATGLRLPPWAVVGAKDAFDRPVRAWFTVGALVLSVVTITFVCTTEWTIRQLTERPELIGEPFEMAAGADDPVALANIKATIDADKNVRASFERGTIAVTPEGKDEEVNLAVLGPGYDQVDWVVSSGRLFSAPGEATVGKGFLDLMGAEIGDTVTLTVMGKPIALTVVGMYRATEDDGRWAMTSTETVRQVDPDVVVDGYAIGFHGAEVTDDDVRRYREAGATLIETFDHEADGVEAVRGVLAGLGIMLLAVGLLSLVNSISLGVRERRRDLAVLKAIGLSPRQVVGAVLSGALLMGIAALAIGIPLGLWLSDWISDLLGNNMGWGPGLLEMPPATWIVAAGALVLLAIVLAALLPASVAVRVRPSEALRAE